MTTALDPPPQPAKRRLAGDLDPERWAAIAERLRFYRELGIYDFYRQAVPTGADASADEATLAAAPILAVEPAPVDEPASTVSTGRSDSNDIVYAPADELLEFGDSAAQEAALKKILLDRPAALGVIRQDLGDCTRCKLHQLGRKQIVFGVGNPEAELMFVGEGPGADEDKQGEPFVGRAGQLLNNMIAAMGLRREQVYIGNVVKCRPPQNRTPERDECETCSPFLMRQIGVVRPKIIVALGAVAARTLLGMNDSMAKLRGRIYDFHPALPKDAPEYDFRFSTKLVVTYHPAFLLRDPRQKKEAWKDLQMVMHFLGLAVPSRSGGKD